MHEHSDWYRLFDSYWWLLFPFFWMVASGIRLWLRHTRAQQALGLIKSYVDQGKEPPAELLKILQPEARTAGNMSSRSTSGWLAASGYGWLPVFAFAALAGGLAFLAFWRGMADGGENRGGLIFTAILMGGLALGFLVTMLSHKRTDNQDRLPPK